jgi:hypothetical protein
MIEYLKRVHTLHPGTHTFLAIANPSQPRFINRSIP